MYEALKDVVTVIALFAFGIALLSGLVVLASAFYNGIKEVLRRHAKRRNIIPFLAGSNGRGDREKTACSSENEGQRHNNQRGETKGLTNNFGR